MKYYEVETLVSLASKSSVFTYGSELEFTAGNLVVVPFGRTKIVGVIVSSTKKPDFDVKQIAGLISGKTLPDNYLAFAKWFRSYYPVKNDELNAMFLPKYLNTAVGKRTTDSTEHTIKFKNPPETDNQSEAIKQISESIKPVILFGGVGSGKTRIYFEAAKESLLGNKSVLILSPEIPLSTQLYKRAKEFFGSEHVMHFHSGITLAKRRQTWLKILESGSPKVIIGPRSAMFLPVKSYGLIVVDEFHASAYKQMEQLHYHANDASAALAKIHESKIIYGSATPGIREFYIAKAKDYPIITIEGQAAGNNTERKIELIDQKNRDEFTKNPYIGNKLVSAIKDALRAEQQVIILHNRRGTARSILCNKCAWSMQCPNCDSNLVYHHDKNVCLCHTCGFKTNLPVTCPNCGNEEILLKSLGSKALALELEKLFPSARIARFDSDNKKHESLGMRMDEVENRQIDILVGTQVLAKGLDLKNLSVIGITGTDSELYLPDYSSSERLFQLAVQAAGRVGRGHIDGKCFIQTYQPDSRILKSIASGDWSGYYETEIIDREAHSYPPFVFMLKLSCSRKTPSGSQKAADNLSAKLRALSGIKVIGPSPSFRGRENNLYVQQIVVKSKNRSKLLSIASDLPSGWSSDLDPISLL
ncbi:MAG: primosomal protein N' [bacterium]|nr:primosomal protein N' [bacterium]